MRRVAVLCCSIFIFGACDQLPNTQSSLAKKKECAQEGWKYYQKQKAKVAGSFGDMATVVSDPTFSYNRQLDTCLCHYDVYSRVESVYVHNEFIVDVLSNKVLATDTWSTDPKDKNTSAEFQKRKKELMTQ